VLNCLQTVRPVHRRRYPGVNRFNGRETVPGGDVFGAEDLAPREVVKNEILREGPVRTEASQGCLPHVPVRVHHPGHEDPAAGADLYGVLRSVQVLTDGGNCAPVTSMSPGAMTPAAPMVRTAALRNRSGPHLRTRFRQVHWG
jgi:hypothetical protein